MPYAPQYHSLATITLGSAAATVTFGSIPSGYRDLRLVCVMTSGNGGNGVVAIRYNGDTAANYLNVGMYGEATSATGSYANTVSYQYMSSTSIQTTEATTSTLDIMDYAQADKHKTFIGRSGTSGATVSNVVATASRWASTSAVTTLNIFINGTGTFAAGSTFVLYGVK